MKSLIFKTSAALIVVILFVANACKKDDPVDCSKVTGATFSTNSGKIAPLLETKCATAGCHATGGAGSVHWEWEANYDTL